MKNKTRKTLKNLLTASLIPLASFLPVKETNAQKISEKFSPKTVYLIFQPGDLGFGFRGDYRFGLGEKHDNRLSRLGIYSLTSLGKYRLGEDEYIKNHLKLGLGGLFYLKPVPFEEGRGFFNFGLSYHDYGKRNYFPGTINEKVFKHLSIDAGFGVRKGNLSAFISVDPLKREGTVGVGLALEAFSKNPMKKYSIFLD
jgi:hypothetical protein